MGRLMTDGIVLEPTQEDVDERAFRANATRAVRIWANRHPRPRNEVLVTAEGRAYTPGQLAREVERRSDIGRQYLDALWLHAKTSKAGPEGAIAMFLKAADRGDDTEEARQWLAALKAEYPDDPDERLVKWSNPRSAHPVLGLLAFATEGLRRVVRSGDLGQSRRG